MKGRTKSGLILLVIGIAICYALSLFFGESSFQYLYLLFGAPIAVSAFLLICTSIHEGAAFGFGVAMYYGTGLVAYFLMWLFEHDGPEIVCLLAAAVIVCLLSYLAWIKHFKDVYKSK